ARVTCWLEVVQVLLPSAVSYPVPKPQFGAFDAMSAAKAAVSDIRGFCDRQPDACSVGSQAAAVIGQRAQAGAKMLYEFLNEQFGPGSVATTGAVKPTQHTLTPADLEPAWRGPQPRRAPRQPPA